MQVQKSLSSISANRDLWMAQYRRELAERDQISGLEVARKKELDEGVKQGVIQRQITLVKKFMAMGHTAEEAAAFAEIDVKLLKEKQYGRGGVCRHRNHCRQSVRTGTSGWHSTARSWRSVTGSPAFRLPVKR